MATKKNKPTKTKEEWQEEALQYEVDILDGEGQELPVDVLKNGIKAKKAELKKESEEQAKRDAAAIESAEKAKAEAEAEELKKLDAAKVQLEEDKLEPTILDHLPKPSNADIELARKYNYPVVIPGARAYRCIHSLNCAYSKTFRRGGEVILLTDEHVANKREHVEPIRQ